MQTNLETEIGSQNYNCLPPIREYTPTVAQKTQLKMCFD